MLNNSKFLLAEEAEITVNGIKFEDRFYSCGVAIKEQWFNQANLNNWETMKIYYDPLSSEYIFIQNQQWMLLVAYQVVFGELDSLSLEHYYLSINALKKNWIKRRKKFHDRNRLIKHRNTI